MLSRLGPSYDVVSVRVRKNHVSKRGHALSLSLSLSSAPSLAVVRANYAKVYIPSNKNHP